MQRHGFGAPAIAGCAGSERLILALTSNRVLSVRGEVRVVLFSIFCAQDGIDEAPLLHLLLRDLLVRT